MIVIEQTDGSLLLVRQPDHAVASSQIAKAWHRSHALAPDMWARLVEAVRRHDDGWIKAEQKLLLNTEGLPLDFMTMPAQQHATLWWRGIDLAAGDDLYMALLIALQARWLYTKTVQPAAEDESTAQQFADELAVAGRAEPVVLQDLLGQVDAVEDTILQWRDAYLQVLA